MVQVHVRAPISFSFAKSKLTPRENRFVAIVRQPVLVDFPGS